MTGSSPARAGPAGHAPPDEGVAKALARAQADAQGAWDRCHKLEAHVRRILDATHDGYVVLDGDAVIVDWNPGAGELLGWSRPEVVGRRLVVMEAGAAGPPGSEISQLFDLQPYDPPRSMEAPMLHRDGEVFQVRLTVWATDGGADRVFHALLSKVGVSDQGPQAGPCAVGSIVTSSSVAIVGQDLGGRIMTWNRAAEAMYGYPAAEALGRPGRLVAPAGAAADADRLVRQALQGRQVQAYETVHVRRDGSPFDASVTISPVRDQGGPITGVSLIVRDVTDQRRAAAAIEEALEDARRSEASSRRFLADAAHQLRTPIAGIRACVDTLGGSGSVAEAEVLLAHMVEETARASRLIRGLLRVARLDRGVAPEPVPCDLVELCNDEAARVRLLAPQLQVKVRAPGADRWERVVLDPDIVREILGNLLDNARRHAQRRVEVEVRQGAEGSVEVHVADDGPGMADDMVEGAFERFVSLDGRGGSGLGLPIARGLAESHGGGLTYEAGVFVLRLA